MGFKLGLRLKRTSSFKIRLKNRIKRDLWLLPLNYIPRT